MDPWHELGLDVSTATVASVKAARRRLAKALHPDLAAGRADAVAAAADSTARLMSVTKAAEMAIADLAARRVTASGGESGDGGGQVQLGRDAEQDEAIFSVPHLPAEAFELLLLAFSSIGDPKVLDEPYLMEGMVDDPVVGMARVEIVPEAGGSIVTVTTAPFTRARADPPSPEQVAGRLLWELRELEL